MTNIQLLLAASSREMRQNIACLVESASRMTIEAVAANAVELLQALERRSDFSALLLDSELEGLLHVPDLEMALFDIPILLLTPSLPYFSYSGHMDIVEFIEKPLTPLKVRQAERHLMQDLNKRGGVLDPAKIPVVDENIEHLPSSEILFIESLNRDVIVHTRDRQLHTRISLKAYRNYLEDGPFLATHRSFLINLSNIERLEGENVYFTDYDQPALIATDKKADVLRQIDHHLERSLL